MDLTRCMLIESMKNIAITQLLDKESDWWSFFFTVNDEH